jgi:outer membrane protein TolC
MFTKLKKLLKETEKRVKSGKEPEVAVAEALAEVTKKETE